MEINMKMFQNTWVRKKTLLSTARKLDSIFLFYRWKNFPLFLSEKKDDNNNKFYLTSIFYTCFFAHLQKKNFGNKCMHACVCVIENIISFFLADFSMLFGQTT